MSGLTGRPMPGAVNAAAATQEVSRRPVKAVLFDHDGTLADSEIVHYQFWAEVLAGHGLDFQEDQYRLHYVGVSERNTARDLKARFALTPSVDELVAGKREVARVFHASQHYPILPGVRETLTWLAARGVRMAVVSGAARFALEANLEAAGLLHHFDYVASGEEVPANKPAPDVYQHAMAQLGLTPAECIAVEDTFSGLTAARAAGLFTVVIPNRFSAHQDFSGASLRMGDMGEFLGWLSAGCRF